MEEYGTTKNMSKVRGMDAERILSDSDRSILLNNIIKSDFTVSLIEKTCIMGFFAMKLLSPNIRSIDEYVEVCRDRVANAIIDALEESMRRLREAVKNASR
jgi:hypothetical protein